MLNQEVLRTHGCRIAQPACREANKRFAGAGPKVTPKSVIHSADRSAHCVQQLCLQFVLVDGAATEEVHPFIVNKHSQVPTCDVVRSFGTILWAAPGCQVGEGCLATQVTHVEDRGTGQSTQAADSTQLV
jgi:hypothetical protein